MDTTSQSEIKLGRRCLKAHDYRYNQRIRRKKPNRPAFIGTILHEMLDALAKLRYDPKATLNPWQVLEKYEKQYAKLFREEQEEFGDVPKMAEVIFEGYMRRWKGDGLKIEASEIEVSTPLIGKIHLKSKLDIICLDKSGRRFLSDHKFHKNIPGPEDRFSDIQTVLYFWVWNREHKKADRLDGIMWDYGRMKAPAVPQLLKSGKLSQRGNIDTDWHTYLQAIKEHDLRVRDYSKMMNLLAGKERTFFERVFLPSPDKKLVEFVVEDAQQTVTMLRDMTKKGHAPRNMSGFNCNNCEYRRLCEAEVRGLDAKFIRKRDYETRDDKGELKYGEEAA